MVTINYFIAGIQKNLDFFGGGFSGLFNMFSHGAGVMFFESNLLFLIFIVFSIFSAYKIFFKQSDVTKVLFTMACFGGVFGFSVLTLTLPFLLLLLVEKSVARPSNLIVGS